MRRWEILISRRLWKLSIRLWFLLSVNWSMQIMQKLYGDHSYFQHPFWRNNYLQCNYMQSMLEEKKINKGTKKETVDSIIKSQISNFFSRAQPSSWGISIITRNFTNKLFQFERNQIKQIENILRVKFIQKLEFLKNMIMYTI